MDKSMNVVAVLAVSLFASAGLGCGGPAAAGEVSQGVAAEASRQASPCRQPMASTKLVLPAGNELELELSAVGVQIYTCTASPTGAAWVFTAPEATLYRYDRIAGKHYAGPTWEAKDGSKVVAAKIDGFTPDPTAIPWLLLGAVSHAGDGRMDEVTYVQRVATHGGLVPTGGCDASTVGAVARVPYTATYCFHEKAD